MNEITFRRAIPADIPALTQLRWDMCVEQGVADPEDDENYAAYREALHSFLSQHLARSECQIYVAEMDAEQVIATGALWLFPILPWPGGLADWYGYVTNVYTVPLYRRQKIARRMMETLARVAAQHGAIAVMLTDTIDSQRLYNRMGFAPNHMLELKLDRYRTEESDG